MRSNRYTLLVALLALPALAAGWPDAASRLNAVVAASGRQNLAPHGEPRTAALAEEGYVDLVMRDAGAYTVAAACDERCSDIDLWVFGPDGRVMARSTDEDARPVADVRVVAGQALRVRAQMVACRAQVCDAAVGAFRVR